MTPFNFLKPDRTLSSMISNKVFIAWLKKVSEFERVLFPGLEIKAFSGNQKAEAEAWLSSQDDICR